MVNIKQKLLRFLLKKQNNITVSCNGWVDTSRGVRPCFKSVKSGDAIQVSFVRRKQFHQLYFCSFQCLKGWQKNSFWEDGS